MASHRLRKIVALAGGVGAARFLSGLIRVVEPDSVFVIGNTADDAEVHGLHVSPDLDTVTYTLAGMAHPKNGWGVAGDTFRCLEALGRLGDETWFQLGDRDLATNLFRTARLREGATLSEVTRRIAAALDVRTAIVPMSDDRVRTRVFTARGEFDFQTWFVRRRARDAVRGLRFEGIDDARPAPGVLEAIRDAAAIIVCPSNPFISVGPILAVPGIREALRATSAPIAAVSPIVGGRALKGPASRMMKSMGMRPSSVAVARMYRDFASAFVIDRVDEKERSQIEILGMRVAVTDTVMTNAARKKALARLTLDTARGELA